MKEINLPPPLAGPVADHLQLRHRPSGLLAAIGDQCGHLESTVHWTVELNGAIAPPPVDATRPRPCSQLGRGGAVN